MKGRTCLITCSITIILASFSSLAAKSERSEELGVPFLRNFSPKEYGAEAQNWAIVQDKRGVIYVGNNSGVLEYDGSNWRLIQTTNKTVVRSLAVDDAGRIYVGAQGEIGYLAPNEAGALHFVSLNDRIEAPCRTFSDVWHTYVVPGGVFFQSRECLFRLSGDRIQAWKASPGFHKSYVVHDRFFIRQFGVGLLELVGDKLELVKGGERFAQEKIYAMFPMNIPGTKVKHAHDGGIIIGSRSQGLFVFDSSAITPFPTEVDDFLKKNLLYCGILLDDGTLALGTIQGGMVRINREGKLLGILDKAAGLQDDTVYFIQPDGQAGLWLAHDKGISHIEWPAPVTLFDGRSGLSGNLLSLHRHQDILYAGTGQGIFVLRPTLPTPEIPSRGYRFKPVIGIRGQNFSFISFDEILLTANTDGVFEIRGDKAILVRPANVTTMSIYRSPSDPARVFVGLQDGLASMYRQAEGQGSWMDEGKIAGIPEEVRNMVETEDGRLWLGTQAQGILRVTFAKDWRGGALGPAPSVERFWLEQGLPVGLDYFVYPIGDKILFATTQGVYVFDEASKRFFPVPRFAKLFLAGPRKVLALHSDAQGWLWMDSTDQIRLIHEVGAAVPLPDGTYRWEKTPFLRFAEIAMEAIQIDKDGIVWFGGPEGLVRYDPRISKEYAPHYSALIRHVEKAGRRSIFEGAWENGSSRKIPILKYAENALRFEFSLPAFDKMEANRFRLLLEGFDKGWSEWLNQDMKEYTNLPEGRYAFRVKARNIYERESGEAIFRFVISPPWYRTWPAYLGFTIIGLAIIVGIVRAYTFRLQREKERLEKLVALRTQELKEASLTDPLTGLRNRRFIQEILTNDITAFVNFKKYLLAAKDRRQIEEMQHTVFGLLLFDIDHFKVVNDTHGHDAGDQVLQQFAQLLKDAVRADDAVLRIGGEEFLIVLKKTKLEYLDIFVEKIMKRVQETDFVIGENLTIRRTCSIGYTVFPFYADQPERLSFEQTMMVTDLGLYHAKEQGRNLAVRIGAASHVPQNEEEVKKMVTSLEFAQQLKFTKVNKLSLS